MKKSKTTALVVLDGSTASAYLVSAGEILGSSCEIFAATDAKKFVDSGVSAASKALSSAMKAARKTHPQTSVPEKTSIALYAPWVHGELYDVSLSYDEPTKKKASQIVDDVEDARSKHAESLAKASKGLKLTCVSARTVRLFENGYAVARPVGGSLRSVRATTFAHYMSVEDRRTLEEGIRKATPGATVEICSVVSTLVSDACKPDDGLSDALILSVSANVTEAVVVLNDMVDSVVTIPMGYSELIAEAERSLPVAGDSFGFLLKFALGELSERESDRARRVIDRAASVWSEKLGTTLRASGVPTTPPHVVLAPAPAIAPLIANFISQPSTVAELFSGTKPRIHPFPHTRLLTTSNTDVF
jgi:hypothetical protein